MSRSSEYAHAVASLYQQQGEAYGRAAANKGQIWGNAIANIGQIIPQAIQAAMHQRAADRDEKAVRDLFANDHMPSPQQIIQVMGPERGLKVIDGMKALQQTTASMDPEMSMKSLQQVAQGLDALPEATRAEAYPGIVQHLEGMRVIPAGTLPTEYDPQYWKFLMGSGAKPETAKTPSLQRVDTVDGEGREVTQFVTPTEGASYAKPKPQSETGGFTLSPGSSRFDSQGNPIASVPATAGGEGGFSLSPGGARYDASGKLIASRPESAGGGNEPLVAVLGPDGRPVLVRRSQAEGKSPASSREQGRPVPAASAQKVADINSALNDLATLTKEIPAGTTGVSAKAGALAPNWFTQWTGIGATAKSKQAVIDRVKQVIGKSLEGGVLRKEDEAKYEKILPTIGDVDSVVATKLKGLKNAIAQKWQTELDALSDAGYDTSQFQQRGPSQPQAPSTPAPQSFRVGPYKVEVK